jgi:hypothetical protein
VRTQGVAENNKAIAQAGRRTENKNTGGETPIVASKKGERTDSKTG